MSVNNGTTGRDTLIGTAGDDVISADNGNDILVGYPGWALTGLTRISTASDGTAAADGDSMDAVFSPDGTKVAFDSRATNLVPNDTNGWPPPYMDVFYGSDIFIRDLSTGTTTRVTAADGTQLDGGLFLPMFSLDGSEIAFLRGGGGGPTYFIKNLTSGALTQVSSLPPEFHNPFAESASVSSDGTKAIVFGPYANPAAGDYTLQVFVKDLTSGALTLVATDYYWNADYGATTSFSPDGSKILFTTDQPGIVPGDSNSWVDVFVATLSRYGGNDTLIGGAGLDTAVFAGARAAYTITHEGDAIRVSGPGGNDVLSGIEIAKFDDQSVLLGHDPLESFGLAGDFNGDGKFDILWQNDNGAPGVWLMNGTTAITGTDVGPNPSSASHIKGAGNFEGNGKFDILWQNDNGQASIWLMNGTSVTGATDIGWNPGPAWHVKSAGDFDGDGKADILWQNDNGQAGIWLMNGTSVVAGPAIGWNPGPAWHVKGTGDFNGDGKADILWQNSDGSAGIWLMDGTNVVSGTNIGPNPSPSWHIMGAGDFNGDGKSDILWQKDSGQLGIWLMNGTTPIAATNVGPNPGPAWHVQQAGDFNGDGKSDVLWQNDNGQAGIWLMDGTAVVSATNVGDNPGTAWHIDWT